jgi:hypothetical protein
VHGLDFGAVYHHPNLSGKQNEEAVARLPLHEQEISSSPFHDSESSAESKALLLREIFEELYAANVGENLRHVSLGP